MAGVEMISGTHTRRRAARSLIRHGHQKGAMDTSGTPARAGAEATTAGIAQQRSRWWYLVPLLLAIVGGVVAYFAVRRDDPRLARNCLVLGVALTAACVTLQAGIITGAFLP